MTSFSSIYTVYDTRWWRSRAQQITREDGADAAFGCASSSAITAFPTTNPTFLTTTDFNGIGPCREMASIYHAVDTSWVVRRFYFLFFMRERATARPIAKVKWAFCETLLAVWTLSLESV